MATAVTQMGFNVMLQVHCLSCFYLERLCTEIWNTRNMKYKLHSPQLILNISFVMHTNKQTNTYIL